MTADGASLISNVSYFLTNTKMVKEGKGREGVLEDKIDMKKGLSVFLVQEKWKKPQKRIMDNDMKFLLCFVILAI